MKRPVTLFAITYTVDRDPGVDYKSLINAPDANSAIQQLIATYLSPWEYNITSIRDIKSLCT